MNVTFVCGGDMGHPAGELKWSKLSNGIYTYYDNTITNASISTCDSTSNGTSSLTIPMRYDDDGATVRCEMNYALSSYNDYLELELDVLCKNTN